jgi:hypothetical protein
MFVTITVITLLHTSFYCYRILLASSSYLFFGRYCSVELCYNCYTYCALSKTFFFAVYVSVYTVLYDEGKLQVFSEKWELLLFKMSLD